MVQIIAIDPNVMTEASPASTGVFLWNSAYSGFAIVIVTNIAVVNSSIATML
jgi:hypothetical protein